MRTLGGGVLHGKDLPFKSTSTLGIKKGRQHDGKQNHQENLHSAVGMRANGNHSCFRLCGKCTR